MRAYLVINEDEAGVLREAVSLILDHGHMRADHVSGVKGGKGQKQGE